MKRFFVILFFLSSSIFLQAQDTFFTQLKSDAYIFADDKLIKGEAALQNYISKFGESYTYNNEFRIQVNDHLDYEMGELKTKLNVYSVLFISSKSTESTKHIELLVISKKEDSKEDLSAIDVARANWIKLCNAHNADNLVSNLYHKDAYYYNRGRLLKGTKALSREYSYMNDPNYSLQLTPKQVIIVNANIAFELGRCSGSYPLPYLLVWQKHPDTTWKIVLDSNF